MVTNEEQLKRFQEWSGVVTSLCQALSSVLDILLTCVYASWQRQEAYAQKAGAPRLHPVTNDSLLQQLRDLLKLVLLWMVKEGLRQRRSSEQRALSIVSPQLALDPRTSVYPVQMGLLPRLPELTATKPELREACNASSLKTNGWVVNDTGSESLSARPCLPASNCDSLQPGSSTSLRRSQRLQSKNRVNSHEVLCGATTNQHKALASIKALPVAIATKAHEAEMKTADLGAKETKDGSLVYNSASLNFQAVQSVPLESASLDLLQAVDWTYLDQRSTMKLQKALAERRRKVAGREEDGQKGKKEKASSALNTTNQAQFRLNKAQRRRIRTYVKELSSYPERETLAGEVVFDVLDYTVPWDGAIQTLSNLTSVAVKKSQATVASLKGSVESRMGSTLKQGEEATSSHVSSQLLQRKRGPMPETAPVGKHDSGKAHKIDGLTIPALLPEEEVKRHKPETAQGTPSRSKRTRINRRCRKTFRAKADKTVDQGRWAFLCIIIHPSICP